MWVGWESATSNTALARGAVNVPVINSTPLANGTVGTAFEQTLVSVGTSPFTWVATTTLPTGMILSTDGTYSGTPATAGEYTVGVKVTDANGFSSGRSYTWTVVPAPVTSGWHRRVRGSGVWTRVGRTPAV